MAAEVFLPSAFYHRRLENQRAGQRTVPCPIYFIANGTKAVSVFWFCFRYSCGDIL